MARILREQLPDGAEKVPRRNFPDAFVRLAARFDPGLRSFTGDLGRQIVLSNEKAQAARVAAQAGAGDARGVRREPDRPARARTGRRLRSALRRADRGPPCGRGDLQGEYFAAAGEAPHPGVVVLHESFGLNDDIRAIAAARRRPATRRWPPACTRTGGASSVWRGVMVDMVERLDGARGRPTSTPCAKPLPRAHGGRWRAHRRGGLPPGRGLRPDRGYAPGFSAAAVNYGDGAIRSARSSTGVCPVVAGYGARDRMFGRDMAERLEDHLGALGVPADVKVYDGAGHSFFSEVDGWQGWLARMPTPMAVGYERAGGRGRLAAHARVLRRARVGRARARTWVAPRPATERVASYVP